MKTQTPKNIFLTLILMTLLAFGGCTSSGTTPSVEIPAPVAHLSISSPDDTGEVRITADAGFADAGTTTTITNPNVTSSWLDYLLRLALAHATHEVTVNTDGSFQESIEASVGDTVSVTYTSDGVETSENLTVPDNTPPLPNTTSILDVSFDPNTGKALVVANDGVDGFVHVIDVATKTYESTITLAGASGAAYIATDPTTGDSIVLDTTNVTATKVTLAGGGSVTAITDIIPSADVAAGPAGDYVLIAHTDSSPALSFFDMTSNSATAIADAESSDGTDQDSAILVATDNNGTDDVAAVVSQMPDDSFLLTTHTIDESVPFILQNDAITLDVSNPFGLAFFSDGDEALVTDFDVGIVYHFDVFLGIETFTLVGNGPCGVVVDETTYQAFVVNSLDRTVSVISLDDDTVSGTEDVGLTPTEAVIAEVSGTSYVVIINTGDNTVSILD